MIKETNKLDKTSNRLLRKLMRKDINLYHIDDTATDPNDLIRVNKIRRDLDCDLAPDILLAMGDVAKTLTI